jgi:hypothetical protein
MSPLTPLGPDYIGLLCSHRHHIKYDALRLYIVSRNQSVCALTLRSVFPIEEVLNLKIAIHPPLLRTCRGKYTLAPSSSLYIKETLNLPPSSTQTILSVGIVVQSKSNLTILKIIINSMRPYI